MTGTRSAPYDTSDEVVEGTKDFEGKDDSRKTPYVSVCLRGLHGVTGREPGSERQVGPKGCTQVANRHRR